MEAKVNGGLVPFLPQDILLEICARWLNLKPIVLLDVAISCEETRADIISCLSRISSSDLEVDWGFNKEITPEFYQWLLKRGFGTARLLVDFDDDWLDCWGDRVLKILKDGKTTSLLILTTSLRFISDILRSFPCDDAANLEELVLWEVVSSSKLQSLTIRFPCQEDEEFFDVDCQAILTIYHHFMKSHIAELEIYIPLNEWRGFYFFVSRSSRFARMQHITVDSPANGLFSLLDTLARSGAVDSMALKITPQLGSFMFAPVNVWQWHTVRQQWLRISDMFFDVPAMEALQQVLTYDSARMERVVIDCDTLPTVKLDFKECSLVVDSWIGDVFDAAIVTEAAMRCIGSFPKPLTSVNLENVSITPELLQLLLKRHGTSLTKLEFKDETHQDLSVLRAFPALQQLIVRDVVYEGTLVTKECLWLRSVVEILLYSEHFTKEAAVAVLACPQLKNVTYGGFAGDFCPGLLTQLMLKLEVLRIGGVSVKKEGRYRTARLPVILKNENSAQKILYCLHELHSFAYVNMFLDVYGSEFTSEAARELFQALNLCFPSATVYFQARGSSDYNIIDQLLIQCLPNIRSVFIEGCMDCTTLSSTRDVRFFCKEALKLMFYSVFATEFEELYVFFNEPITSSDSQFTFPQLPNIRVLYIQSVKRDFTWLASVLPCMEKMETIILKNMPRVPDIVARGCINAKELSISQLEVPVDPEVTHITEGVLTYAVGEIEELLYSNGEDVTVTIAAIQQLPQLCMLKINGHRLHLTQLQKLHSQSQPQPNQQDEREMRNLIISRAVHDYLRCKDDD